MYVEIYSDEFVEVGVSDEKLCACVPTSCTYEITDISSADDLCLHVNK